MTSPPGESRNATVKIIAELRTAFRVDFGLYKQSMVERRIARRMAVQKIDSIDDYLTVLSSDPSELRKLYGDLLNGVTSFFRDGEPFEALKESVFPQLAEGRHAPATIRFWVAGCAAGEEAYSIAIALLEYLGDRASKYDIQIFATDVDEDALARARNAIYPQNIERDVSPKRLRRFFHRSDNGYQVRPHVRALVVFARHNLGQDPPFSRLDLIACRNVLISMQAALRKKVLRMFHYALNADACLLLGASELVRDLPDLFALSGRQVIFKRSPLTTATLNSRASRRLPHEKWHEHDTRLDHRPIVGVAQIADRKVIERYGPPGVIVNERLDVLQFRGGTGQYLEPAPGVATLNLLKLVRPELLVGLRTVIYEALGKDLPATTTPVLLRASDGTTRAVRMDVMPLPEAGGGKCLLVLFNENVQSPLAESQPLESSRETDTDTKVLELERELATNKECLQSAIDELEATNAELQGSNDELQSSNEELQSINEELATMNDELHERMRQLTVANDDLQNVLLNTSSAILVAGTDLRIRRFSTVAEKVLSLVPSDIGRPISYLRNSVSARDVEQVASDAILSMASREQRVRCIDGSWYVMKFVPYMTSEQMIRGLVIEFVKTAPAVEDQTLGN